VKLEHAVELGKREWAELEHRTESTFKELQAQLQAQQAQLHCSTSRDSCQVAR